MTTPAQTPDLSDFTPDSHDMSDFTPDTPATKTGLGMQGQSLSVGSSVPNARIRNLPNPAAGLSPGQALYEGAKTGLTLASIPASTSMSIPTLAGSIVGGTVGNVGGSTIAKAAGAGPFGQEVAGDIGGFIGGMRMSGAAEGTINSFKNALRPPVSPAGDPFAMAPKTPEAIAAQRYQAVPLEVPPQKVPLGNITPTKAATVDPYRSQILPPMTPGVSGNVEAHAYDPATSTMYTHFKSGDIYKYKGVPQQVYNQFQNAESQGSFHYNNIRGRYETTKIGKVAPTRGR